MNWLSSNPKFLPLYQTAIFRHIEVVGLPESEIDEPINTNLVDNKLQIKNRRPQPSPGLRYFPRPEFWFLTALFLIFQFSLAYSQTLQIKITKPYLNIPIGNHSRMKLVKLSINGKIQREFPVQLAEDSVNYWIYIDVSEFIGKAITLSCPANQTAMNRIYQDVQINGADSLYREAFRPQYHFTVKRAWSNDINGPIFLNGTYHLFWQSFPFGKSWNTGYMYWGHATSKDMLHWTELSPALMLDSLGSPWSGTAVIDTKNDGGWGKGAMVVYYTAFDKVSDKEVQCIAFSTDQGRTFQRYSGNPIIDSNWELGTTSTRDPKVFWYEPAKIWVMVLFENDGLSIYNSMDMKSWKRQSHLKGLYECPDLFELPVDGNQGNRKWVIHGGSSNYYIGSFDGKTFTPETSMIHYAEGKSWGGDEILYAAQSFANMPDGRVVQMAWGRIQHPGMPFSQAMLFPTEFSLITINGEVKMVANPIKEIESLHGAAQQWRNLTANEANEKLKSIQPSPLHIKMSFRVRPDGELRLRYQGDKLIDLSGEELGPGNHTMEILLDKTIAEFFIDHGRRYIIQNIKPGSPADGLVFDSFKYGPDIEKIEIYEMKSVWETNRKN